MWFLILLTLINAAANQKTFVLTVRLDVGGMPINIFDGLMALGVLATICGAGTRRRIETGQMHPVFKVAMILLLLGFCGAGLGAFLNGAPLRNTLNTARNFIAMPILLFLGYRLVPNLFAAYRFARVTVWAGAIAAAMIMLFFYRGASELDSQAGVHSVRVISFVSTYGGTAAALLLFSVMAGVPLLPRNISLVIAGFCFLGQCATLSRSDWLAALASVLSVFFITPSIPAKQKVAWIFVAVPIIAGSIWMGIYAASKLTGRDVYSAMENRVKTMLPGEGATRDTRKKAWDTRLPGTLREIGLWAQSPLWGQGFGIHEADFLRGFTRGGRHNTWTSTLAESGLLGFGAMSLMVGGMIVVGRRMIRDRFDQASVLIGALGVVTGTHFILHGLTTMSFNQIRWAIPVAVTCGVVMRTRAMQLALMEAQTLPLERTAVTSPI